MAIVTCAVCFTGKCQDDTTDFFPKLHFGREPNKCSKSLLVSNYDYQS